MSESLILIKNNYYTETINKYSCEGCLKSFYDESEESKPFKNIKNLEKTKLNSAMLRCEKCKIKVYCIKCKNKLMNHKRECKKENGCFIFHCIKDENIDPEKEAYNIYLCPENISKSFMTPQKIEYKNKRKIIYFNESKEIIMITDEDKVFWVFGEGGEMFNKLNMCSTIGKKICNEVLKEIFPNKEFKNIKSERLKNKKIELETYNEELNIAIEYNGEEYYKFLPYYHISEENFTLQFEGCKLKKEICKKEKIKLITIDYTLKTRKEIKEYILSEMEKMLA